MLERKRDNRQSGCGSASCNSSYNREEIDEGEKNNLEEERKEVPGTSEVT